MPSISFSPSGLSAEVPVGTSVLQAARSLGVDLDSVCGGRGICGRCQVTCTDSSLSAFTETEAAYSHRRGLVAGRRLGCIAEVRGDVSVEVPPESQVHRPVVRKQLDLADVVLDPAVHLAYLDLAGVAFDTAQSLTTALLGGAARVLGSAPAVVSSAALDEARAALEGAGDLTVAIRDEHEIVAAWPGFAERVVGVAVDIGSTTIAAHLCDLSSGEVLSSAGRMNPQIRFGDDLMSRVSFVMMNPGGERQLTEVVRSAIDELIGELCADADVERDAVMEIVLVGNPVMHHLVAGFDPTPLGQAPFTLHTSEAISAPAAEFELACPHARVYLAPCIAGHVGADTAAVILSEGPHRSDTMQLLVDVGTNAEIVLGDRHRQFAASSPTGPAFEGAQLSCGQRATVGAIERVRIDRSTLEPRFKVIGCELWSDDPAFAEATSALSISGVCGSGIIEVIAEMYLSGIIDTDGVVQGALAAQSARIVPEGRTFSYVLHDAASGRLAITQNDVRAIQLAKAALRAGIELLERHAGITEVDDIRLAGAFGSHIDPLYALVLGLVPDCPVEHVRSIGNAAGAGAVRALLSVDARHEMESAVRAVVKIETATETDFQAEFVAAMAFPHATRPTPHLAESTALPERISRPTERQRRRQSRTSHQ